MRIVELFRLSYRMLVFLVSTLVLWSFLELQSHFGNESRVILNYRWTSRWSRFNLRVFGIKVLAQGACADEGKLYPAADSDGIGHIFIANHSSGMDIPVMLCVAETHVISRHDLATWPLLGRAARRVGTLFVDRSSRRSGALVLREVDETLERGEGIAMFPEGTAFDGDEVHEFRPGALNAARRSGAAIIPIGFSYDNPKAYYSRLSFMSHWSRIARAKQIRVAVEIGKPLRFEQLTSVEMKTIARDKVQELVDRARQRLMA